ncbi:hypothetical protein LTR84_010459 [Exophiala bonariae]|uniref:Major facilitator superfamily (MFS) profile domain-containing protein n=1 Tax=Exophiala bonariae TaxID=1690606 RepID=A0AAV9MWT2_9EURO|nr:hypothetical protein LTR84_010459 [Exophiala bonariae]
MLFPYDENNIPSLDVLINGPFNDKSEREMRLLLNDFLTATGLRDYEHYFTKGMFLAQNPAAFDQPREDGLHLTQEEKETLVYEEVPVKRVNRTESSSSWRPDYKKWRNISAPLWRLVCLCALGAAVQGWDESAVNGAQLFYQRAFRIHIESDIKAERKPMVVGLVNSAPYLACFVSCWLTPWSNRKFGRRGTIFWTAICSAAFAFAQAFANTWEVLFVLRFLMGFGIGPKSATIPIYAAECSPANLRGSLVMLWQLFTAVGIMLGSVSGVVLQDIGSSDCEDLTSLKCSLNWRLMLASPAIAPIVLALYIYTQSESPRWLINEGHRLSKNDLPNLAQKRYEQAWVGLKKLRRQRLQAAKDMFEMYYLLQKERREISSIKDSPERSWSRKGIFELFSVRRNRRAMVASLVCMFAQQFCGV